MRIIYTQGSYTATWHNPVTNQLMFITEQTRARAIAVALFCLLGVN